MSWRRPTFILSAIVFLGANASFGQGWLDQNLDRKGYLKYMSTAYIQSADTLVTDNLIHNRLTFRLHLPSGFRVGVEMRNRIFFGELVSSTPGFGDAVTSYDGVLPLEILWVDGDGLVMNTIFDRLWVDYSGSSFEARVGRQRINWGINPVWNPNDLFNAFNYLDFDYEERPGADAARLEYYVGEASSVEVAFKLAENSDEHVGAMIYKVNTNGYDLQALAGRFQQDWSAGVGWAGNLGDAGFKGEGTLFVPSSDAPDSSDVTLSASTSLEYAFRSGWSGTIAYLLNTNGAKNSNDAASFLLFEPTAKHLMPNRHTVFLNFGRQLSPISFLNFGGFYAFEVNWIILFPAFTYSVATNWDLDLIGQLFWGEDLDGNFGNQGNAVFFRTKWSF
jgi:hypothetical protein